MTTLASYTDDDGDGKSEYTFVDGTVIEIDPVDGFAAMTTADGDELTLSWGAFLDELELEHERELEGQEPRAPNDILAEQFGLDRREILPYVIIALGQEGVL